MVQVGMWGAVDCRGNGGVKINHCYLGDCRDVMRELIADGVKVQTIVTSPPYFGLRDYGSQYVEKKHGQ